MWKAIDKLAIFFSHVFQAFKFAAYDYDVYLRRTKTPTQRVIIWSIIFIMLIVLVFSLLWFLKFIIQTVVKDRFTDKLLER